MEKQKYWLIVKKYSWFILVAALVFFSSIILGKHYSEYRISVLTERSVSSFQSSGSSEETTLIKSNVSEVEINKESTLIQTSIDLAKLEQENTADTTQSKSSNLTESPVSAKKVTSPPVNSTCPQTTQKCVPCDKNDGHWACRVEANQRYGYLGVSCQSNNPGNIRPAAFKEEMIKRHGGAAPCGKKTMYRASGALIGDYMAFSTYNAGFGALKAYIKAISAGEHPFAYFECGQCSLKRFFSYYAPSADQNDPNSYANIVAREIGVNADTTMLDWIVANKLDAFALAIQRHEGWFVQ